MIKLQVMKWPDAKKNIQEEIDKNTNAIFNILQFFPQFLDLMPIMFDTLELAQKEETTVTDITIFNEEQRKIIDFLLVLLPGLPVVYPMIDWELIINSIMSIIDNYIGVQETVCLELKNNDLLAVIYEFKDKLIRCAKNLELGTVLETLVPLLAIITSRLEHVQSINPFAFELSQQYLEALNMKCDTNICS